MISLVCQTGQKQVHGQPEAREVSSEVTAKAVQPTGLNSFGCNRDLHFPNLFRILILEREWWKLSHHQYFILTGE